MAQPPKKNKKPKGNGKNGKNKSPKKGHQEEKKDLAVPIGIFRRFLGEVALIAACTDAAEVAQIVIDKTCEVLACDRTSFFFVDGEYLDLVVAKGADNIRLPIATGFAGACATTGKMINIPDAYKDKRFNPAFDKKSGYHTSQILCACVRDPDGEIIGVLQSINKNNKTPFDVIDEELMNCLAGQVGVSIRYAYQLEEARKAKSQKDALISYIRRMNPNSNVPSLLFTLNKAASELLEADRCTFYTITNKTMHLVNTDAAVDISFPVGAGLAGYVGSTGNKLNIVDAYKDDRFNPAFDKKSGYRTRSMLVMPVWDDVVSQRNKIPPIAVVQLINKKTEQGFFNKEDEEILETLLRFVGPLIKNSHLFVRKEKTLEADRLNDFTLQKISRQPSREILPVAPEMIEEGEEEEDDLNDDNKENS